MIIPIIAGFALGTIVTHSVSRKPHRDSRGMGHHSPDVGHPSGGASTFYLTLFTRIVEMGKTPSEPLTNAAIEEASNLGDWQTAEALTQYAFEKYPSSETVVTPPNDDSTESAVVEESEPPVEMKSPFEGVKDDDWRDFIEALKTQPTDYKSDTHVGAFYQHRNRISQLGISEDLLSSQKGQYDAITSDIVDHHSKGGAALIKKYTAEPVTINGSEHIVTASGVLSILKSAGPKGAAQWLSSDKDREKYAKTTDSFLRCNGCF